MKQENFIVNGEAMSASQENVLVVEQFLTENYLFRRNILNGKVEFAKKVEGDEAEAAYRPLTQEALNSIVLRALREEITESNPKADIQMYVNSEEVPQYNPIGDFLEHLPAWDGENHVARLFSRLPGITTEQAGFLAIWLRSTVRWTSYTAMSAYPYLSALRVVARPPSCADCCLPTCASTIWTT